MPAQINLEIVLVGQGIVHRFDRRSSSQNLLTHFVHCVLNTSAGVFGEVFMVMSRALVQVSSNLATSFFTSSIPESNFHFHSESTDVLRIRSYTSGKVVKSFLTKLWN